MDTLVHALVLYQLAIKSVTTVTVKPTTWLEIIVELVKEMVLGLEVTHLVFMVRIIFYYNNIIMDMLVNMYCNFVH